MLVSGVHQGWPLTCITTFTSPAKRIPKNCVNMRMSASRAGMGGCRQ